MHLQQPQGATPASQHACGLVAASATAHAQVRSVAGRWRWRDEQPCGSQHFPSAAWYPAPRRNALRAFDVCRELPCRVAGGSVSTHHKGPGLGLVGQRAGGPSRAGGHAAAHLGGARPHHCARACGTGRHSQQASPGSRTQPAPGLGSAQPGAPAAGGLSGRPTLSEAGDPAAINAPAPAARGRVKVVGRHFRGPGVGGSTAGVLAAHRVGEHGGGVLRQRAEARGGLGQVIAEAQRAQQDLAPSSPQTYTVLAIAGSACSSTAQVRRRMLSFAACRAALHILTRGTHRRSQLQAHLRDGRRRGRRAPAPPLPEWRSTSARQRCGT